MRWSAPDRLEVYSRALVAVWRRYGSSLMSSNALLINEAGPNMGVRCRADYFFDALPASNIRPRSARCLLEAICPDFCAAVIDAPMFEKQARKRQEHIIQLEAEVTARQKRITELEAEVAAP